MQKTNDSLWHLIGKLALIYVALGIVFSNSILVHALSFEDSKSTPQLNDGVLLESFEENESAALSEQEADAFKQAQSQSKDILDETNKGFLPTEEKKDCETCIFKFLGHQARPGKFDFVKASAKKWKVCSLYKHPEEPTWQPVNYGMVKAAKELGVEFHFYLENELDKFKLCATEADGLIYSEVFEKETVISKFDGEKLRLSVSLAIENKNDVVMPARLLAAEIANYLKDIYAEIPFSQKVAILPGPRNEVWVEQTVSELKNQFLGTNLNVVTVLYSENSFLAQSREIFSVVRQYPEIDIIIGTATAANSASRIVEANPELDTVQIYSLMASPELIRNIRRGKVQASANNKPILIGQYAVHQMVLLLQGQATVKKFSPAVSIIDKSTTTRPEKKYFELPYGYRATMDVY